MKLNSDEALSGFKGYISRFITLNPQVLSLLTGILEIKNVSKGTYTLEEGKICCFIDYVHQGSFRAFYNLDGVEVTTSLVTEGSCITNMKSLSTLTSSKLNIQALEQCVVVRLYKEKLIGLYDESPALQTLGRSILEAMVIEENDWKEMYALYKAEERYSFLVAKAPMLLQRMPLQYLASFLGMRRETLSRVRAKAVTNKK